jgi:hypothetical protein
MTVKGEKWERSFQPSIFTANFTPTRLPDVATGEAVAVADANRGLLDEDMSNTPFLLKAVSGLLIAAAAPVYCVWCLRKMSMEGTIQLPQNTRAKLERSFETTLLKYPDKPESSNGS